MPTINLLGNDPMSAIIADFEKVRPSLSKRIANTRSKYLLVRINAPSLCFRKRDGEKRYYQGAVIDFEKAGALGVTSTPGWVRLREVDLTHPEFPPSFGVAISQYLAIEDANAEIRKKNQGKTAKQLKGLLIEHATVPLADCTSMVVPFEVGSKEHWDKVEGRERIVASASGGPDVLADDGAEDEALLPVAAAGV